MPAMMTMKTTTTTAKTTINNSINLNLKPIERKSSQSRDGGNSGVGSATQFSIGAFFFRSFVRI